LEHLVNQLSAYLLPMGPAIFVLSKKKRKKIKETMRSSKRLTVVRRVSCTARQALILDINCPLPCEVSPFNTTTVGVMPPNDTICSN